METMSTSCALSWAPDAVSYKYEFMARELLPCHDTRAISHSNYRYQHQKRPCGRDAITEKRNHRVIADAEIVCGYAHTMRGVPDDYEQHSEAHQSAERVLQQIMQIPVTQHIGR